jgi:hypothetical protein
MGVVGDCIGSTTLNQRQVASGDCTADKPAEFRAQPAPGNCIVRNPGGNRVIEIKRGAWTKIDSITETPLGSS